MAIYAFSPIAALVLNIVIFIACAFAFFWIRRREIFFRTMLLDWMLQKFSGSKSSHPDQLVVFPKSDIGSIPARSKCLLEKSEGGWTLTHRRMMRSHLVHQIEGTAALDKGWWTNSIMVDGGTPLTFSSRYSGQLDQLANAFDLSVAEEKSQADLQIGRQVEFA